MPYSLLLKLSWNRRTFEAMRTGPAAALFLFTLMALSCTPGDLQLRDGDIIFQMALSSQSLVVQRATQSRWSHMGIILTHNGRRMVFEVTDVVKFTPLNVWVKRGKEGRCIVKRLKNADAVLTTMALEKLQSIAARFEGRPYDAHFSWSDEKLYCSELVWKIFERSLNVDVGLLQKLGDLNLEDEVVKAKLRERYGELIPLNETVISPERIYTSELLETVYEQN